MKKIRAILMWMLLLTKRLYKKPAFLAILLIVPVVVFAYSLTAQNDSGMLTIVVAAENPQDSVSASLINELQNSSDIIRFIVDKTPETGTEMVKNGAADAVWIIPANISDQIREFVADRYTDAGFVRVVVREETVPMMLANEKLSGRLFVQCARTCFLQYVRAEAPEVAGLTDSEIIRYFDGIAMDDDLFSYAYVENATSESNARNYLLMPVRGILAILVVIGAMAAAMFYIADEQEGLFSWVSLSKKSFIELGYQFIAIINVMLVICISLVIAKLNVNIFREILCALMYVVCCCVFGQLLRLWCKSRQCIGMLVPIVVVAMLIICPVFISLPGFKALQLIFPPTYYLNALYNSMYFLYMLMYTLFLWGLYKLSTWVLKRN